MTRADSLRSLLLVGVIALEAAVTVARLDASRAAPFSGRFSWSMFAGPLTASCHHALAASDPSGRAIALPLPADNPSLRAVLLADTPPRFAAVAPYFAPYADRDAEVARALDDLLARYHRASPVVFTLTSTLRCASPGARPFARTARWTSR